MEETLGFLQVQGYYGKRAWEQGNNWEHKLTHPFIHSHIHLLNNKNGQDT